VSNHARPVFLFKARHLPTPDEIRTAVATDAEAGIQSATVDGNTVVKRSLDETLDIADRLDGHTAVSNPARGLRFTALRSPGGHS
jgi:hypothetical protein